MSHFGTHAHRSRIIFPSDRKESDLKCELLASKATWLHWFRREKAFSTRTDCRTYAQVVSHNKPYTLVTSSNPKPVPLKATAKNTQTVPSNCGTSTSRACVKRSLHTESRHLNAPVMVQNRFEVLASHTDTSNAVLEESLVNKAINYQYRAGKKKTVPSAYSDKNLIASDPDCMPACTDQVSTDIIPVSRVKNLENISPLLTVPCHNTSPTEVNPKSQSVNMSTFSQPNAPVSPYSLDCKTEMGFSDLTYSNTAIPLSVWENRFQCVDYQCCTQQNGFEFGAVPLTPIKLYEGKNTYNKPILDIIRLHNIVRSTNCPFLFGLQDSCTKPTQT